MPVKIRQLPDAIDTAKCIANSQKTAADEFVCGVVYLASGYDIASYGGAIISVGSSAIPGEILDAGLATIKVSLKAAAAPLGEAVLKPALATLQQSPELIGSMALFVAKRGDDAVESSRTWIKNSSLGKGTLQTVDKMLADFGELTLKQTESLGRAVKGLGAETWTQAEKKGLHKYIELSPEEQGDAIMVAMRKSGEFDDSLAKQAVELNPDNTFKNVEFVKLLPDGKDADNFIRVGGKDYWIDSTAIKDELISEQNLYGKLLSDSRRYKFESLGSGGIQVIELEKGTKLTKTQIEATIQEALPQMPGTSKIKVFDATTGEVFWGVT